jgi:uncharacterized protein with HEPN domain
MYVDDQTRLRHMLDAAREVVEFTQARARDDLTDDRLLVHGLVRCLEIIGEAASRVSKDGRDGVTGIPWVDVIGMRHKLVHEYFRVDLDIVWNTCTMDVPALIPRIEAALAEG